MPSKKSVSSQQSKVASTVPAGALTVHPKMVAITFQAPPVMAEILPFISKMDGAESVNEWIITSLQTVIESCLESSSSGFRAELEVQMGRVPTLRSSVERGAL